MAENVELTEDRNDLALSRAMRELKGVKHLDLDLVQYSGDYRCEIFFEATSQQSPKNATFTRRIAKAMDAYAILVVHAYADVEHNHTVKVTVWDRQGDPLPTLTARTLTWEQLQYICRRIHVQYLREAT